MLPRAQLAMQAHLFFQIALELIPPDQHHQSPSKLS